MTSENVYNMKFGKIYPLLVNKAMKKGRTQGGGGPDHHLAYRLYTDRA